MASIGFTWCDYVINIFRDNVLIFSPFVTLPSRTLVDYYQLIKHPVSLKSVQKLVKGIHGRAPSTGKSDFQSWDAFGAEVAYIWDNCRTYNEDGSEMYNLANDLEVSHAMSIRGNAKLSQTRELSKKSSTRSGLSCLSHNNRSSN